MLRSGLALSLTLSLLFVKNFDAFWVARQPAEVARIDREIGVRERADGPEFLAMRDSCETGEATLRAETAAFTLEFPPRANRHSHDAVII